MAKKIVILDPNRHPSMFHGENPVSTGPSATRSTPTHRRSGLENRHRYLEDVAVNLIGARHGPSHARSMVRLAREPKRSEPTPRLRVLAGIGALLLEEEDFHGPSIADQHFCAVLDNILVHAIRPPRAEADAVPQTTAPAVSVEPDFWHLKKIGVASMRSRGLDGKGIRIGVLDSGIDANHREFRGKDIVFAEFGQDGQPVANPTRDAGTHGTHVCGLLAGDNAGVAPAASLAVAAVLTVNGGEDGYLAQILAGLDWLITHDFGGDPDQPGVHLVNASFSVKVGYNPFLYHPLLSARNLPGVLMVAAVGNEGSRGPDSDTSPGNYDLVVGVGATDSNDAVASFSSWGTVPENGGIVKPDLCAPGVALWSSLSGPGDRYVQQDGTSMASPLVAGAAALLLQEDPSLVRLPASLRDRILERVVPLSAEVTRAGRGRLQLGS